MMKSRTADIEQLLATSNIAQLYQAFIAEFNRIRASDHKEPTARLIALCAHFYKLDPNNATKFIFSDQAQRAFASLPDESKAHLTQARKFIEAKAQEDFLVEVIHNSTSIETSPQRKKPEMAFVEIQSQIAHWLKVSEKSLDPRTMQQYLYCAQLFIKDPKKISVEGIEFWESVISPKNEKEREKFLDTVEKIVVPWMQKHPYFLSADIALLENNQLVLVKPEAVRKRKTPALRRKEASSGQEEKEMFIRGLEYQPTKGSDLYGAIAMVVKDNKDHLQAVQRFAEQVGTQPQTEPQLLQSIKKLMHELERPIIVISAEGQQVHNYDNNNQYSGDPIFLYRHSDQFHVLNVMPGYDAREILKSITPPSSPDLTSPKR